MEEYIKIKDKSIKLVEIENEGKKYICKIKIIEELIEFNILLNNELKYKNYIFLEKIQNQIKAFYDYNIYEIFDEIYQLNKNNFNIIKENNIYKLKIKFIILRKEKYLYINLNNNILNNILINELNNELINKYENIIKEKENIIIELNNKIKLLQNQLNNNNKINNNDNLYNNFDIKLKNSIHILNNHTNYVLCLTILNDGRLVSGSSDKSIIIYNKITYKPDLIIKEHNNSVYCIIQLSSDILGSCSADKTIKLFKIKENKYNILQTLNYHKDWVYKIIELKNKYLVSCSEDSSIIFYNRNNSEYKYDYKISTNGECTSVIETKENEICYSEYNNDTICFYDINERKIKSSISNISKYNGIREWFIMISKDLLLIPGENKISIININEYKLIKIIEVLDSNWICGVCMLNQNMLLTGDEEGKIKQWRIEGDNLILISTKENAHNDYINVLLNMGDGHIVSCSDDKTIKIW